MAGYPVVCIFDKGIDELVQDKCGDLTVRIAREDTVHIRMSLIGGDIHSLTGVKALQVEMRDRNINASDILG